MFKTFKMLVLVCAAFTVASANAATVSFSFSNSLEPTEINQTGSLALFDSNLGTLTGASLLIDAKLKGIVGLSNSASQAQRVRAQLNSDIGISSSLSVVDQLFNNVADLSITFDTGLLTIQPNASYTSPLLSDAATLTHDLGTALGSLSVSGGGNFTLNCTSLSGMTVWGGGGNLGASPSFQASCGGTITYTYDPAPVPPVPVPAGGVGMLGLMGLGILGLAARMRRKPL